MLERDSLNCLPHTSFSFDVWGRYIFYFDVLVETDMFQWFIIEGISTASPMIITLNFLIGRDVGRRGDRKTILKDRLGTT